MDKEDASVTGSPPPTALQLNDNEVSAKSYQPPPNRGYTPTGGSTCQQSSIFIMLVLLLCTMGVVALVAKAAKELTLEYSAELANLKDYRDRVNDPVLSGAFLAEFQIYKDNLTANGDSTDELCDFVFLSDTSNAETIVSKFAFLEKMNFYFFVGGACAASLYLLVKSIVLFNFTQKEVRDEKEFGLDADGHQQRKTIKPVISNIMIGGEPETRAERRTRIYLRSETLTYMLDQGLQDVPIITFALTFILLKRSPIGTRCTECFGDDVVCAENTVDELPFGVQFAFGAVVISLLWNASLLAERWIQIVKYRRYKKHGMYNFRRYMVLLLLFFIGYAVIIVSPTALLIAFELQIFYGGSIDVMKFLGIIGGEFFKSDAPLL